MSMSSHTSDIFPGPYAMYHQAPSSRSLPRPTSYDSRTSSLPSLARPDSPSRSPRSSHSTASDDGLRPSLPSIRNLLGIANADRPGKVTAQHQSPSPPATWRGHLPYPAPKIEHSRHPSHTSSSLSSIQGAAGPAFPSSRHDSAQDGVPPSPLIASVGSPKCGPPYYVGSSINNLAAHQQHVPRPHLAKHSRTSSQPDAASYRPATYTTSPYPISPNSAPAQSFYSPSERPHPKVYLPPQQQRLLPTNFPPTVAGQARPTSPSDDKPPAMNPWEHHHYISSSASTGYPSPQDRYQCMTCNKAFSRPSSLKIHSHSHTGEKPFRCPHAGCSKSFSVRSNMKRHERGCHSGGGHLVAPTPHLVFH